MTTLTFRQATPADAPRVQALVFSAYRGESSRAGWTTEADLLDDERIDDAGVLAKITKPNSAVLLALDPAGALVSCCEVAQLPPSEGGEEQDGHQAAAPTTGYFGMFAVDPLRQAGGLGRQVLAEAEAFAQRTWGVRVMQMSVIWTREELIAWYVRRGYRKTERTAPFPYAELINAKASRMDLYFVILEKEL